MLEILLGLIDRFEGTSLVPYRCPAGIWTIGKGHTKGVTKDSPPITPRFAAELAREDALEYAGAALKLSPNLCTSGKRHAAVSDFCFNLGTTRYKGSTLRRKIRDCEWLDAADEMQKWIWGGGRRLPGLVLRRAADAALL